MKKYIKPCLEYTDLTILGRLMDGLQGGSAGGGIGDTDNLNPDESGQGLAPWRKVF